MLNRLTLRYTTCCGCEESLMCTKMSEIARPRFTDQKMTCIRTGVRKDEASQSESPRADRSQISPAGQDHVRASSGSFSGDSDSM